MRGLNAAEREELWACCSQTQVQGPVNKLIVLEFQRLVTPWWPPLPKLATALTLQFVRCYGSCNILMFENLPDTTDTGPHGDEKIKPCVGTCVPNKFCITFACHLAAHCFNWMYILPCKGQREYQCTYLDSPDLTVLGHSAIGSVHVSRRASAPCTQFNQPSCTSAATHHAEIVSACSLLTLACQLHQLYELQQLLYHRRQLRSIQAGRA